MSEQSFVLNDFITKMQKTLSQLKHEFSGLRTGRATISLLEPIYVDAYGAKMPMAQVGTISVPEARLITVTVWDKGLIMSVEKAIREASLGVNPAIDGDVIRVPIPSLTEERRKEIVKLASKYSEQAKIATRSIRKEAMDVVKKLSSSSKDEQEAHNKDIQNITDKHIKEIDEILAQKEKDILQI